MAGDPILTWDENTEEDLKGYKVYYGLSSREYGISKDVLKNTSYEVKGLEPETTYYFAVTAYDTTGNESEYSVELEYTTPKEFVLKIPSGLTVRKDITVQWYKHRDTSVVGYKLYYGKEPDKYTEILDVAGRATTKKKLVLEAGVYYFRVGAYNAAGTESPLSAEIKKEVALEPVEGFKVIE